MNKLIFGCGYLGRRVAQAWQARGHTVTALTRSPDRADELRAAGITPLVGDICDPDSLRNLPEAETVLFAVGYDARSGRSRSEVVIKGLRNVLNRVPRCREFLAISTTSVYGQSDGSWVDEQSPCEPAQPNGICALTAEEQVRELACRISDRWNILRLSGIYGPGRLLTRVDSLRSGQPLSGSPDAWLNLIHVEDAVQSVLACEQPGIPSGITLVSDDEPVLRETYYGRLAELAAAPPPTFNPDVAPARGAGGRNKRCRNVRMKQELGVRLRFPTFNEGLPHALAPDAPTPDPPVN